VVKSKLPEIKHLPFGTIPLLQDGEFSLSDSGAILYYLGAKTGLVPSTREDQAKAVMLTNAAEDLRRKCFELFFMSLPSLQKSSASPEAFAASKESLLSEFRSVVLSRWFSNFDRLLTQNNGGKAFFLGDKLTYADIAIFDVLDMIEAAIPGALATTSVLSEFVKRMNARPKIIQCKKSSTWF